MTLVRFGTLKDEGDTEEKPHHSDRTVFQINLCDSLVRSQSTSLPEAPWARGGELGEHVVVSTRVGLTHWADRVLGHDVQLLGGQPVDRSLARSPAISAGSWPRRIEARDDAHW